MKMVLGNDEKFIYSTLFCPLQHNFIYGNIFLSESMQIGQFDPFFQTLHNLNQFS